MESLVSGCRVQLEQVTPWQWSSCDGDDARRSRLLDSTHKRSSCVYCVPSFPLAYQQSI